MVFAYVSVYYAGCSACWMFDGVGELFVECVCYMFMVVAVLSLNEIVLLMLLMLCLGMLLVDVYCWALWLVC